ncbi:MAG: thiosulfate oxidation carrier protein SoxY [Betaproteobacteria bacterium]|nr:thiosulfate oxidation carrier protein SoxY [Betaproteobacteria bacterium]
MNLPHLPTRRTPGPEPRRRFLGSAARALVWVSALPLGLGRIAEGWAARRNEKAFNDKELDAALIDAGVPDAIETDQITLHSPELAENGALVHLEIESRIPDTQSILVFAEKNPQPLVAQFDMLPGLEPFVAVRIKMAESAFIRIVVRAGGRAYYMRKETKVTEGGCGEV